MDLLLGKWNLSKLFWSQIIFPDSYNLVSIVSYQGNTRQDIDRCSHFIGCLFLTFFFIRKKALWNRINLGSVSQGFVWATYHERFDSEDLSRTARFYTVLAHNVPGKVICAPIL